MYILYQLVPAFDLNYKMFALIDIIQRLHDLYGHTIQLNSKSLYRFLNHFIHISPDHRCHILVIFAIFGNTGISRFDLSLSIHVVVI